MVAYSIAQRLTPNLALAGAGAAGVLVALATLAIPYGLLEEIVVTSGIAAFVPAAEPPLGTTARICVGVFAGGAAALIAWFVLSALLIWRDARDRAEPGERRPVVRRADAHPDAPPRPPLLATRDLGMPFRAKGEAVAGEREAIEADVHVVAPQGAADEAQGRDLDLPELPPEPVIAMGTPAPPIETIPTVAIAQMKAKSPPPPTPQPLPADLDQPLSAFDPGAIPDLPLVPPPNLAPLSRAAIPPALAEGERFETFALTPPPRPSVVPASVPVPPSVSAVQPENLSAPETDASVHALLDRLERGIARRTHQAPAAEAAPVQQAEPAPEPAPEPVREPLPPGLEGALAALRKMAVRA
ncbi:hypothetical protein [Sphingomonas sp.]|uniref:hypothetical protein n=1 Tax=Sphingomonas sp. TaxID=28214 RepID=UPI002EDA69EE